ncbi:MAG: hypothetical protein WA902_07045 [Thermosynechococcaceae cyanobacterium]
MSNPIQDKATEWWQLISGEETAESYKNFFKLTWKILKETALLLWLMLCFVLVAIGWVWNNSSKVTETVSELKGRANQNENSNLMADTAVKLWEASQSGAANAVAKARKRLDLPEIERTTQKKTPVAPPREDAQVATPTQESTATESQQTATPSESSDQAASPEPTSANDSVHQQNDANTSAAVSTSGESSDGEVANPTAAAAKANQDASNLSSGEAG